MKESIMRGLAVSLATLLLVPTNVLPASAEEASAGAVNQKASEVTYNPGAGYFTVYDWNSVSGNDALLEGLGLDANEEADVELFQDYFTFDENGNYTIQAEVDAFFPYEVEFTVNGEKTTKWFETPDSTVEVGGHVFGIESETTGEQITGMTLNVAGDSIVVYPEKEFVDEPLSLVSTMSLLPLEEKTLSQIDLSGYTPVELTQVSISALMGGEATSAEKIAWSYTNTSDNDTYEIAGTADNIDLSWGTYYATSTNLRLIDNNGQQLNAEATRYLLPIKITASENWLMASSAYKKTKDGSIVPLKIYEERYRDYADRRESVGGDGNRHYTVYFDEEEVSNNDELYVKFNVNDEVFPSVNYASLKVFSGKKDITNKVMGADTEGLKGYLYAFPMLRLEAYDAAGKCVGSLPLMVNFYTKNVNEMEDGWLYDADGYDCTSGSSSTNSSTGIKTYTVTLYAGKSEDATYYWKPYYKKENVTNNSLVTAAYVGTYASIAEATAAGATDIKDVLFGSQGYGANYSGEGVPFTIFVGADGTAEQEIYKYIIKCKEGSTASSLSSATYFRINGLYDENGSSVHTTKVGDYSSDADDSYGDSNYFTYFVDKEVDLTKLKMKFDIDNGAKLYAGNMEIKSKETILDFSKGPIQFTVSAENGKNSNNYWVAVYKPVEGAGQLYINSLKDTSAKTEVKDGVVYSVREVMLDSIHDDIHDIMVANLGTEPIANLKVELSADATVALDDYWQLDGQHSLEGFSDSYGYLKNEDGSFSNTASSYGKLWNLAKVRLVKKDGVEDGTDVTGTLTFKSGDTTLMVLTLTGTVGDPTIITKEIPAAVKYVPYGVMIQNSNKYNWNTVTYDVYKGELPAGMDLKPNGEIYGIPTEVGEYNFTIRMQNSSSRFENRYVYKKLTLTVVENTDANVDGATDEGYTILDRIPDLEWDAEGSYSIRSNGAFANFKDIYLDGVKLVEGTDYTKSEGSTRVTISSQTLKASKVAGVHTLGMEFREGTTEISEGTLKKAAQNYYLLGDYEEDDSDSDDYDDSDDEDSNDDRDSKDSSSNSSTSSSKGNAKTNTVAAVAGSAAANVGISAGYTIQAGDTLWTIAEKYYGSGSYWKKIYEDNADKISDPDKIFVGQQITLNPLTASEVAVPSDGSTYTVQSGDTLWKIAQKLYGKGWHWRKIYQLNEDIISDPENIYVGQVIRLPE